MSDFLREDADFTSQGVRCAGWLYRPTGAAMPPVIIMAHGFAGQRAFGLPAFAEHFAAAGYAVFLFDYRTFGDSEGTPRDNVDPFAHGEDWDAAIAHVRTLPGIDTSRITLWGTSFSGAHVICAAARDGNIAATISQVPYSGMPAGMPKPGLGTIIKFMLALGLSRLKQMLTDEPLYVPVVGPVGSDALLGSDDSEAGYNALIPEGATFSNRAPITALPLTMKYSPIPAAVQLDCPALVIAATQDSLIPLFQAELMASKLTAGEFTTLDCGHFDPYVGPWFDKNIALQMDFLSRHVPISAPVATDTTATA